MKAKPVVPLFLPLFLSFSIFRIYIRKYREYRIQRFLDFLERGRDLSFLRFFFFLSPKINRRFSFSSSSLCFCLSPCREKRCMRCLLKVATVLAGKLFHRVAGKSSFVDSRFIIFPLSSFHSGPRRSSLFSRWNLSTYAHIGWQPCSVVRRGKRARIVVEFSKCSVTCLITELSVPLRFSRAVNFIFVKIGWRGVETIGSDDTIRHVTR